MTIRMMLHCRRYPTRFSTSTVVTVLLIFPLIIIFLLPAADSLTQESDSEFGPDPEIDPNDPHVHSYEVEKIHRDNFNRICNGDSRFCVLAFVHGDNAHWAKQVLKGVMHKFRHDSVAFAFVNVEHQLEFANALHVNPENAPRVTVLQRQGEDRDHPHHSYATNAGKKFRWKLVDSFVERVLTGELTMNPHEELPKMNYEKEEL